VCQFDILLKLLRYWSGLESELKLTPPIHLHTNNGSGWDLIKKLWRSVYKLAGWHYFTVEYKLKTVRVLWERKSVMEIEIDSPVSGNIGIQCTALLE
jgi:hypothetical protein